MFTSTLNFSKTQKLVIYDSPYFHDAIPKYCRLQDYFRIIDLNNDNDILWWMYQFPKIALISSLAESTNATLVSGEEVKPEEYGQYPQIKIHHTAHWSSVRDYRNRSYQITDKLPPGVHLVKVREIEWNFVYCSIDRQEKISVWDFTIFADPLDSWTWLWLITAFIIIVPLSGKKLSRTIMPAISATLSLGTTAPSRKSQLFLLWMVACMLIGNLYSGEITSKVMVPPKDVLITHFDQLEEMNFAALHRDRDRHMLPSLMEFLGKGGSPIKRIIRGLLEKVEFLSALEIYGALAHDKRRLAYVSQWPSVHSLIWTHNVINDWYSSGHRMKKSTRKCHVGKELASISERFVIFLPPENLRLVMAFVKIVESGIYQRWDQEEQGLLHSFRVQDRVRIKSPTKIFERETANPKAQSLTGKMLTMFLLWIVCIFISIVGFCSELGFQSTFDT